MANRTPAGGIVNLGGNCRLVHGNVSRDPQIINTKTGGFFVKFGIIAGLKKDSDEKLFVDCVAYSRSLAAYCKDLQKGDPICGIGNLESREYNEKTYWDLNLSWCNSPVVVPDAEAYPAQSGGGYEAAPGGSVPKFEEVDDESLEDELPF